MAEFHRHVLMQSKRSPYTISFPAATHFQLVLLDAICDVVIVKIGK
jgi:hypothetical protein